jgi:hypothetical protein
LATDRGSAFSPQTPSQSFGTDAHRLLAKILTDYPRHPTASEVDDLMARLVSPTTTMPPATFDLVRRCLQRIATGMLTFLDARQPEILAIESTLLCRVDLAGTVPPLPIILSGRIDLALRLEGEIWLLDHKTGGPLPSSTGLAMRPSSLAYTLLAERRWPDALVRIAQWQPETGEVVSVQLSADQRAAARQVIADLAYSLDCRRTGLRPIPATAGPHCTDCRLRQGCAAYAASTGHHQDAAPEEDASAPW